MRRYSTGSSYPVPRAGAHHSLSQLKIRIQISGSSDVVPLETSRLGDSRERAMAVSERKKEGVRLHRLLKVPAHSLVGLRFCRKGAEWCKAAQPGHEEPMVYQCTSVTPSRPGCLLPVHLSCPQIISRIRDLTKRGWHVRAALPGWRPSVSFVSTLSMNAAAAVRSP